MRKEITFDRFIRIAGIVLLVIAILLTVNYLGSVLLPFFVAWLLAYLLHPIVKFVQNKLHVPTRALSIIVTLVAVIAIVSAIVWLIIPPMIEQFGKLTQLITQYLQHRTNTNDLSSLVSEWIAEHRLQIEKVLKSPDMTDAIKAAVPQLFSFLGQTANIIISIIGSMITLLYMFFILLDYEYLTDNWIRIFPVKARPFWQELMNDVFRVTPAVKIHLPDMLNLMLGMDVGFDFVRKATFDNSIEVNRRYEDKTLKYNIRGTPEFAMVLAVTKTLDFSRKDADNDGVIDRHDLCPNTELGVAVNSTGLSGPVPGDAQGYGCR